MSTEDRLTRLEAQIEANRRAHVTQAIDALISDGRLPRESRESWIAKCLADPTGTVLRDLPGVAGGGPISISAVGYSRFKAVF